MAVSDAVIDTMNGRLVAGADKVTAEEQLADVSEAAVGGLAGQGDPLVGVLVASVVVEGGQPDGEGAYQLVRPEIALVEDLDQDFELLELYVA